MKIKLKNIFYRARDDFPALLLFVRFLFADFFFGLGGLPGGGGGGVFRG